MISEKNKIIFIHINRTGGTSIESFFKEKRDHDFPKDVIKKIGKDKWNEYFKFSIVRNPWDRLVSIYSRRKQTKSFDFKNELNFTFDEWLYKNKGYIIPQTNWICNKEKEIIVDYVGRYEKLEKCFEKVCKICKIKNKNGLKRLNSSNHRHYSSYYTSETTKIVKEMFKEDIEKFEYSFESKKISLL